MSKPIRELNMLSSAEREQILTEFNDTAVDYPRDKCVHQLFEEQAEKTPDKTAVIACDKTLTYRELNEQANRIAHSLIAQGVKPGDIVAFKLPRRSYLIATMFGILKAGAAYMPIDPDYPQDRIEYMLSDSNAKLCITDDDIPKLLSNDKTENPNIEMTSENICYCIYTSGSTGKPKAVLIKHKNTVNFCSVSRKTKFQSDLIDHCEIILALNSICFDITVQEIELPLLNGKCVLLANEDEIYKIDTIPNLLNYENLGLIITPTKLSLLIKNSIFCSVLKDFNVIMVGAESFPENLYDTLRKYTNSIIYNGFGPTETTCGISYYKMSSGEISIGKPIANTQIYIVDKRMRLVPIGVTGELCIAGDGVGVGYLNRPELTAEKFVDNPFGEGKMYKTGDLAYWREDGNIMYVGRNDFQVKIRGLRIELGEIENAICSVSGISQAVVIVRKDENDRQLICAFYTGEEKEAKDIRFEISKRLPKYMLPHFITHIEAMPLTSSGKINRNALPEINLTAMQSENYYVAPKTETEKALCKILEEILEYSPVGINDSFFDIGGDSLKAIEFVSKAHSDGIIFTLQNVFDYPTVKELCKAMQNSDKAHIEYAYADFEKYKPILEKNSVKDDFKLKKKPVGNVLLTGSTGFLGCHIIDKFMQSENGIIYCLVRENADRLWGKLNHYFGDKYKDCDRIIPVVGDMESLSKTEISDVDMVIHTAASVKHYGSYKYFYDINVGGTKSAIEFAKRHNAKLMHISTISVSGNAMADAFDAYRSKEELFFSEQSLYVGQSLDNVYIRSKFEAERAVLDAMLDGLQANIIRVGNLTNRESDGKFQPNYESNAFLKRVKAVLEFGYFPDYLMPLYSEFSPIDCTADAIIKIAEHFNDEYTVFNVNSEKGLYFDKMFEILHRLGINMNVVSSEEFLQKLNTPETQFVYEALINDMDENSKLVYDSNIHIVNDFTVAYLNRLGFEWPEIGYDYLEKYINYFRNIRFLEV